jgi:hypothetical protein
MSRRRIAWRQATVSSPESVAAGQNVVGAVCLGAGDVNLDATARSPLRVFSLEGLVHGLEHFGENVLKGGEVVGKALWHFVVRHVGLSHGAQDIACAAAGTSLTGTGVVFAADPFRMWIAGVGVAATITCSVVHFH